MSKFIQQKIDNFKKIINYEHPSLTEKEKKAINTLSNYFNEKKFKELIINSGKEYPIYLLSYADLGVVKRALIVSKEIKDIGLHLCEFTKKNVFCHKISGPGLVNCEYNKFYIDPCTYFIYEPEKVNCTEISELCAWECYIDFTIAKNIKEYQIACDAYDRKNIKEYQIACGAYDRINIKERLTEKIHNSLKFIINEELKREEKDCTKMIESIKSIII